MKRRRLSFMAILLACMVGVTCPAAAYITLGIDVTDSQDPVMAEQPFTYTIWYEYNTPGGGYATIIDQLPPEVSFSSATDGGVYDGVTHSVRWDVGQTMGSTVFVTVIPNQVPIPACEGPQPPSVLAHNIVTISQSTDTSTDTESTLIIPLIPVGCPEFPTLILPAAVIAGLLATVFYIRRNRET